MKLHTIAFATLIAISTTASAEFMPMDNGQAAANGAANAQTYTTAQGQAYSTGTADANGWGRGNGNADGEVEFQIVFKGKGKTDMNADSAMKGSTNGNWYTTAKGDGYGNGYGNTYGYTQTQQ
ncbi:MAG: Unknown protein [uncultured Thiotrichaceae bacterium]|uniref:Uncharacterized protein n=1 Tax=uncultured Thiotrichaceae bacterium TaxID=298394 RepID=A0A6S6U1U5_9GAMM|nr:MAG: Unknown protein [uncultured Thiotrichaceae bacterium]